MKDDTVERRLGSNPMYDKRKPTRNKKSLGVMRELISPEGERMKG